MYHEPIMVLICIEAAIVLRLNPNKLHYPSFLLKSVYTISACRFIF